MLPRLPLHDPDALRAQVEAAMAFFDHTLRPTKPWKSWEQKLSHRFAINMTVDGERRLYPIKHLIALALDIPASSFSGGPPTNRIATALGYTVVPLTPALRAELSGLDVPTDPGAQLGDDPVYVLNRTATPPCPRCAAPLHHLTPQLAAPGADLESFYVCFRCRHILRVGGGYVRPTSSPR